TLQALIQANGITNPSFIYPGQQLLIPGGQPPPGPSPSPPPASAPPSSNLLPNPSFEAGYSHLYGAPELQVPSAWHLGLVEGGGAPGTGLTYLRPESRVLPRWSLPAAEHSLFIWDGDWTVKVFKGSAPMSFRLTTRLRLEPGTYRFHGGYFSDLVAGYENGRKVWATQPAAGEVAFVLSGGGSGWRAVIPGAREAVDQTFTIDAPGEVDIGLAFRTRYPLLNNGFFMDNWSLQRLGP
ncbi:MAG: LysM domain-containing protein, partial [Candidatus Promineifilaceae bacterium]|nr:LysM domain-containing protein [Candidatus Promineifilaceae bacterium]